MRLKRNLTLYGIAVVIAFCLGVYAERNSTVLIAAVYPPNYDWESHCFIIKKDGTVNVTKGRRADPGNISAIITDEFIVETEEDAAFKLSQDDTRTLLAIAEELDALGVQAEKWEQLGGYVGAVYYNHKMHEVNDWDGEDEDDPPEIKLTNDIIIFLVDRSPIPLNMEVWWF